MERRYQPVTVGEPTQDEAIAILTGLRDKYEAHHRVKITDDAITAAVTLSARYISDRFLPDKAIDLIDEAGSRVKLRSYSPPEEIKRLEEEIRQLEAEKTASVNAQDFEGAARRRDKETHGRELLEHKKEEWKPPYLYAKFDNGKIFEKEFHETEYGFAFSVLTKESCYRCKFKGNNRQGDIMIGDFWGATEKDVYWNKYGVSCIFAETDKGNDFVQSTSGIKLFPSTFEKVVEKNPRVITPTPRRDNRDKFEALLSDKGLIYAVKRSLSTKQKIKRMIPDKMLKLAKKAYNVIKSN